MSPIFNIKLFYISFHRNAELETRLKTLGFTDVNHFTAIDGRRINLDTLLAKKELDVRAYRDLNVGVKDPIGLPSRGAVGCYLSHVALWEECVESRHEHIWILEDDVEIRDFTKEDIAAFELAITTPMSYCVSAFRQHDCHGMGGNCWMGTHFQLVSQDACAHLLHNAFPISVQVDAYVSMQQSINFIHCQAAWQGVHPSSIQYLHIVQQLPYANSFYIAMFACIMLLVLLTYKGKRCWAKSSACTVVCDAPK